MVKTVHFHIYSLTPGNYRLKAVWETASRYVEKPEINYKPKQGDYESVTSPEIQIEKGKVTRGIQVECLSLVGS